MLMFHDLSSIEIEGNDKLIVELFDKQGERKFVKTKLDTTANTFLTDKNTYVLGYYSPPPASELTLTLQQDYYFVSLATFD